MGAMLYFEMKIFLSLLIFIFSFQSISKAEVVIDNIFDVKLYSDISKYADVENGKKRDDMPKIYTFINKDISIERDDEFTEYYLRTDENYKVVNVTAAKNLSLSIDEFTNKCSIDKKNFISNLALSLEMNEELFKTRFRKGGHQDKWKGLWEDSTYVFSDGNRKLRLMVYCIYSKNLSNNNVYERLSVTFMTEDYYRSHVIDRFEIIKPFNTKFIQDYIFN